LAGWNLPRGTLRGAAGEKTWNLTFIETSKTPVSKTGVFVYR
jgi:hypothetical protein